MIRSLIATVGFFLCFSHALAADDTMDCNDKQQKKCAHFCQTHQGMKSCVIDITIKSGTCTCSDGTTHNKHK